MSRYSTDHKFSEKIALCFRDLRLYEFVNPIKSYPWGGRNRIIGRIRVFEKYLKPEDVAYARWHHMQAAKTMSEQELYFQEPGVQYLNKIMDERSNGKFWDEIEEVAKSQPTVMEYAEQHYGFVRQRMSPSARRAQFRLIISPRFNDQR